MSQPPQQQYGSYPAQGAPPQQQQYYGNQPQQGQQQYYQNQNTLASGPPKNISNDDLLLYVVCFFCPPLAAFWLKGGCETEVLITLVLWFLFWFPGFIYCLFLIFAKQKEREMEKPPGMAGMA